MANDGGIFDATSALLEIPGNFDDSNGPASINKTTPMQRPSLATLNRAHSLEPPDLNSEPPSNDMDESFQAALQFLDDIYTVEGLEELLSTSLIENADASSSSTSDPEDSSTNSTTIPDDAAMPKPKRKRIRVSTKQQIDKLRGTVNELTTQLQSLESGCSSSEAAAENLPQDADQSRIVDRKRLWHQIAVHQLERRYEAERDNEKLREMLHLQVQEAKNLTRILKRRTRIQMMEDSLGVKRHKMLANAETNDSLAILRKMLLTTDEIYVNVDHEFEVKGMEQVLCPGSTRSVNRDVNDGVFLEVLEKHLVPFDSKATEAAVWSALGQIGMQPIQCVKDIDAQVDFYAQNSQQTDDTMMISYAAVASGFRSPDARTIRIRKVMRKYIEPNRSVFISRLDTQPQLDSQRKVIKLRSVIRVVVEKAEPLGNDQEETALIKSHFVVSRHAPLDESFESYADVDMAIAVWDETISRVAVDIESLLLAGSVPLHS